MAESYITRKGGGGGAAINGFTQSFQIASSSEPIAKGDFVSLVPEKISLTGVQYSITVGAGSSFVGSVASGFQSVNISSLYSLHFYVIESTTALRLQLVKTVSQTQGIFKDEILGLTTFGTATATNVGQGGQPQIIKIDENKALLAWFSSNTITTAIATVANDIITLHSSINVSTTGTNVRIIKIKDNQVIVVYRNTSTNKLTGRLLNISGNTLSVSGTSEVQLSSVNYDTPLANIVKFSETEYMVLSTDGSLNSLKGHNVTVSGNTLTLGNVISSTTRTSSMRIALEKTPNKFYGFYSDSGDGSRTKVGSFVFTQSSITLTNSLTLNDASLPSDSVGLKFKENMIALGFLNPSAMNGIAATARPFILLLSFDENDNFTKENLLRTYNESSARLGGFNIGNSCFFHFGTSSTNHALRATNLIYNPPKLRKATDTEAFGIANQAGNIGDTIEITALASKDTPLQNLPILGGISTAKVYPYTIVNRGQHARVVLDTNLVGQTFTDTGESNTGTRSIVIPIGNYFLRIFGTSTKSIQILDYAYGRRRTVASSNFSPQSNISTVYPVKLSNAKVVLFFVDTSSLLWSCVININNNGTFTVSTPVQVRVATVQANSGSSLQFKKLDENKILGTFPDASAATYFAAVYTIDGNTITAGADFTIKTGYGTTSSAVISPTRMAVIYRNNGTNGAILNLYSISNDSFTLLSTQAAPFFNVISQYSTETHLVLGHVKGTNSLSILYVTDGNARLANHLVTISGDTLTFSPSGGGNVISSGISPSINNMYTLEDGTTYLLYSVFNGTNNFPYVVVLGSTFPTDHGYLTQNSTYVKGGDSNTQNISYAVNTFGEAMSFFIARDGGLNYVTAFSQPLGLNVFNSSESTATSITMSSGFGGKDIKAYTLSFTGHQ
jgi:hypothetical protein